MTAAPFYVRFEDDAFVRTYNEYQSRYSVTVRESDKILIETVRRIVAARGLEGIPSLLDVGCSTGNLLRHLRRLASSLKLTGVDLAPSSIAEARQDPALHGVDLQVRDATKLGFSAA